MTNPIVTAELAADRDVVLLIEGGLPLHELSIEEASSLHTTLGAELGRFRKRRPGRLPDHTGGYAAGAPQCQGRVRAPGGMAACIMRALPGSPYCARCDPERKGQ